MNSRPPEGIAAADAGTASPVPGIRPGRRLTAVLLLAAAALDLIRCSLVPMAAPHPAPAAGLIAAGLAAAALSVRTARGCQAGRRWSSWAALLIGATSAPQAAVAGFRSPYTIPDTATAALGITDFASENFSSPSFAAGAATLSATGRGTAGEPAEDELTGAGAPGCDAELMRSPGKRMPQKPTTDSVNSSSTYPLTLR